MEIEIQNAVGIFFPNPYFQQIYFEAVVNAIDAGATRIEIAIKIAAFSSPDSLKVIITDNGKGFTDERFECFLKLLKPQDLHHKGLGRLV
jgi:anti-sigma regulatory factor (Ser/Thr protein kinase)